MLRQILDAHGGSLPVGVEAVFCNTGLEHQATLDFLLEIERRWCPVKWLEYRWRGEHGFEVVDYYSASRNGEPFEALIAAKNLLPNPRMRFCTGELKIRTGNRYAASIGLESWTRVVGLRADEPRRVARIKGDTTRDDVVCPMAIAGHGERDVLDFWKSQPFDLKLPGGDNSFGNCSLCFLKSYDKTIRLMRADPKAAEWWIAQERRTDISATGNGNLFRIDRPKYEALLRLSKAQKFLPFGNEEESLPCNCTD